MAFTPSEKSWLDAFKKGLNKAAGRAVRRVTIFGSKARGDDNPNSDLDVLVIVKNEAAARKRELRRIGYRLAATGEVVPSIFVYTEAEWESRKRSRSAFRRAVERDAIPVL
jgi:antitoxin ChpS